MPKWIVAHHQGVAVTVVICLIPGQQVTCALGTGQHVIDVGTSILAAAVDSMAKDGLISAQEATLLKATVGIGKVIVQVAMASNLLERVMTLGAAGAEVVLPSDNAKAALTITTDVAGKYSTFYKVLKSVP